MTRIEEQFDGLLEKQKIIRHLIASAELRNPRVFNASRERYLAEISFNAGVDYRVKGRR